MGALLAKPIASSFRVWDLTPFYTIDYLNNLSMTPIRVYLFGNKPVRILPVTTWISDKVRFSFDGWLRQRLISCYSRGTKVSWVKALSIFTNKILNKKVAFHWSSVETGLTSCFIDLLLKISEISLPYTNINSSSSEVKRKINSMVTYRWSFSEIYPTVTGNPSSFLYKSLTQSVNKTLNSFYDQAILTSSEETEITPILGTYCNLKSQTSCFLQTEAVTSSNFIYVGTHGYINAQNSLLTLPILLPYERSNDLTGKYFIKGPKSSRSLVNFSFVLAQIYSRYFSLKKSAFTLAKPYFLKFNQLYQKMSNFLPISCRFLTSIRQPPQYEVSPLVQILNDFIKQE